MKKLMNKFNNAMIRAQLAARKLLTEERGDTNFISIAIILIVVIVIAVIFITLSTKLGDGLKQKVNELLGTLGLGGI